MNARTKLKIAGQFNLETAKLAGQRVSKKLANRIKDWKVMVARTDFKANNGVNPAYHCPGSQK